MTINEALQARIAKMRDDYDDLLEAVSMADVTKTLGDTATTIAELPNRIADLRRRKYAYANYLEHKAQTLGTQWEEVRVQIQQAIRRELMNAQSEVEALDRLWGELDAAIATGTGDAGVSVSPSKSSGKSLGDIMKQAAAEDDKPVGGGAASAMMNALGQAQKSKSGGGQSLQAALSSSKPVSTADESQIESLVDQLENAMSRAKNAIDNAKQRITGLYGTVPSNVSQTTSQLSEIETYLERAENATFEFLAGEDVYMVVKAEWKESGKKKDDPDGFFFITSHRVLMEQSEKKGGMLGFGGKKQEGLLWESPLGSLESVEAEKKGLMGGIDLIHLRFGSGGPFGETTIEVKGGINAAFFEGKLKQAISGEIEKERGLERDQATVEALADAPTMCPMCGASFSDPITRGMTQLECAYCGAVVRLGV